MHTGSLSQRWYISYNFLNPNSGKLERHREYGGINRFDTDKSRTTAIRDLTYARQRLLESGWSPFEQFNIEKILLCEPKLNIIQSIDKVLVTKKLYLKFTSFQTLENRAELFKKHLTDNNYHIFLADDIKRKHIIEFLDIRVNKNGNSNRTHNNFLIDLKAIFSKMVELELVTINPCLAIKKVPSVSQKNRAFTKEEVLKINEWLNTNDYNLQMFCRFICYGFMRPIEITKLRVRDIKLDQGIIALPVGIVKTNMEQTKPILKIFRSHLESLKLEKYPEHFYVFSTKGIPSETPTTRDFFSDKFKPLKDALGFSANHTMYALRHTVLIDLMRNGVDPVTLRQHTGQKTWGGFDSYIRSLNIDLPKDISDSFSMTI